MIDCVFVSFPVGSCVRFMALDQNIEKHELMCGHLGIDNNNNNNRETCWKCIVSMIFFFSGVLLGGGRCGRLRAMLKRKNDDLIFK